MKKPKSNASEIYLEADTIRNALVKGSQRGDHAETARRLSIAPAVVSQYLSGKPLEKGGRDINSSTGLRILNTLASVMVEREMRSDISTLRDKVKKL